MSIMHFRTMKIMRIFDRHQASPTRLRRPSLRRSGALPCREGGSASPAQAGRLFIMFAGLLWFGTMVSRADTHYVSLDGGNISPYTNGWASAATNIQLAVDAATALDTVLVSNGTYNLTNRISVAANITVRSFTEQGHGTNDTIVDGGFPDRTNQCFYMSAGTLDGFTIRNGAITNTGYWEGGGGVRIYGNANVFNCYIYGNRVTNATTDQPNYSGGGGIIMVSGLIVSNCTIVGNTVGGTSQGGGIFIYGGLLVANRISENTAYNAGGIGMIASTVSNCTVNGNVANSIGGIVTSSGALITDCVISNNLSDADCGGVWLYGSTMRNSIITCNKTKNTAGGVWMNCFTGNILLSNCVVTANTSSNSGGGGIYMSGDSGSGVVANCTIAGNVAKTSGGGMSINANGAFSQLVQNCLIYGNTNLGANGGGVYLNWTGQYPYGLINCTIANNEAVSLGGGLYATTTNNYIANCIIYGNVTTNDAFDEVYNATAGGTNNYWYNCTPTNLVLGQGNTTNNPLFIDAGNRNYHLSAGSFCINTGTNMNWMTNSYDLDQRQRIRYRTVDMGAYEFIRSGTIYGFH